MDKATDANEKYDSPIKRLQAIVKDFVNVFDRYKPHLSVFYQESIYLKPQYEKLVKEKRHQFKQIIKQAISDGKKCGEFREDLQVEITTMAILGMVNWMYKWYQASGANTIEEVGDVFIDLILHAVLQPEIIAINNYEEILLEKPFFSKEN